VALLLFVVAIATARPVAADQVIVGGTSFPNAKIIRLEAGRLRFVSATSELQTPWISEVELIVVDRGGPFEDFNDAERYLAAGEPQRAIERYRRSTRLVDEFWPELMETRLLMACIRDGRFGEAVRGFIQVLEDEHNGIGVAARLLPPLPGKSSDVEINRAVDDLTRAIVKSNSAEHRAMLQLLRFSILHAAGDNRSADDVATVATLEIPLDARIDPVYEIHAVAVEKAISHGESPAVWAALDQTIHDCTDTMLPAYLLIKGRALLTRASTREELVRAAFPMMRVAVHMRDDPRAAEGLLGTAQVLERIGRPDKAKTLLQECITHRRASAATKEAAQSELARLEETPIQSNVEKQGK